MSAWDNIHHAMVMIEATGRPNPICRRMKRWPMLIIATIAFTAGAIMSQTLISIRPVIVISQTFTDGERQYETATAHKAWGVFVKGPDLDVVGTAPNRMAAVDAAASLAEQNGWRIVHIAPEGAETAKAEARLQ
ncbi:hypothetical protein ACFFP0_19280 [Rhizobium puerariae]|uniref:DUF2188 domain-containing protein n=1 Tax=Rhizobium puerariae TaxID=1585791 RepID=A0ABV6AK54_9HYPH